MFDALVASREDVYQNEARVVEALQLLVEILVWGDQNDPRVGARRPFPWACRPTCRTSLTGALATPLDLRLLHGAGAHELPQGPPLRARAQQRL